MNEQINIQDESGDKKYFTIIPNYVLNHSSHWDREVYIQMKRIAGEKGTCWMSKSNLSKKCGISKRKLDKSIQYLLEHHWIEKSGLKEISSKGGNQKVTIYKIVDLWNINNSFYKGGAYGALPLVKGGAQNDIKGGAYGAPKEEPLREEDKEVEKSTSLLEGTGVQDKTAHLTPEFGDGYEPKEKKQRSAKPKNQQALKIRRYFSDKCHKELEIRPVEDFKGYKIVLFALGKGLDEKTIYDLFDEWFGLYDKTDEQKLNIGGALSAFNINNYRSRNGK